ncbi:15181_t:CDS:2 [Entrophospora sp. SA101]|nr:15567_t:CDS:2 [Entrophospora sp. SA101]CAJ0825776.1 15181_t:CDS:2 [Entrophospora sp. SA101]CAJ0901661.1 12131_t:CDS:2 [Entrophospora sp. SA101]
MHDPKLLLQELISARKAAAQFSRGSRLAIQLDKLRTPAVLYLLIDTRLVGTLWTTLVTPVEFTVTSDVLDPCSFRKCSRLID